MRQLRAEQRALILGWYHPTKTVLSLAHSLAAGLRANGVRATVLDLNSSRHRDRLGRMKTRHFDFVFAMGSPPLSAKVDGTPIYEKLGERFYFWVLDPIINDLSNFPETWAYFNRAKTSDRLLLLFPDRSYMEFAQGILGGKCCYFPYAGNYARGLISKFGGLKSKNQRVLVLANVGQEQSDFASNSLQEIVEQLDPFGLTEQQKLALIDHIKHDERHSNVTLAVRDFMQLGAIDFYEPKKTRFLTALDASEKRRRRLATLNSIEFTEIDVIGSGWRELLGELPHIAYQERSVPHQRLPDLFAAYSVLLDFAPNWDAGFNDRVITSLGAGCRVVTTRNSAVEELGDAAPLVTQYSAHQPRPEHALREAAAAPPIGTKLISEIKKKQNWSQRLKELIS
jgi:hypothetical protein